MKDRFNFFDVYAYLIPGFTLLGILYFPHAVASDFELTVGFLDAVWGIIAAYLLGHLLYMVSEFALPAGERLPDGSGWKYPSSSMLEDEAELPVAKLVAAAKKLGYDWTDAALTGKRKNDQQQQFHLACRTALVSAGKAAYAEQFHGMYTLSRGVAAGALLGTAYYAGLIFSPGSSSPRLPEKHWEFQWLLIVGVALVALDFKVLRYKKPAVPEVAPTPENAGAPADTAPPTAKPFMERLYARWAEVFFYILMSAALSAGLWKGVASPITDSQRGLLEVGLVMLLFGASRFHAALKRFAKEFAKNVYRGYLTLIAETEKEPARPLSLLLDGAITGQGGPLKVSGSLKASTE